MSLIQLQTAMKDDHLSYKQVIQQEIKNETWETLNIEPTFGTQQLAQALVSDTFDATLSEAAHDLKLAEKDFQTFLLLHNMEAVKKWKLFNEKLANVHTQYRTAWNEEFTPGVSKATVMQIKNEVRPIRKRWEGMEKGAKMKMKSECTDEEIVIVARAETVVRYLNKKPSNSLRTPKSVLKERNSQ